MSENEVFSHQFKLILTLQENNQDFGRNSDWFFPAPDFGHFFLTWFFKIHFRIVRNLSPSVGVTRVIPLSEHEQDVEPSGVRVNLFTSYNRDKRQFFYTWSIILV